MDCVCLTSKEDLGLIHRIKENLDRIEREYTYDIYNASVEAKKMPEEEREAFLAQRRFEANKRKRSEILHMIKEIYPINSCLAGALVYKLIE